MAKKQTMDHAQLLVLSLLAGEDMYGYQMIVELARRSDHTFEMKEGTLYPVLHGLERDGAVEAYLKMHGRGGEYRPLAPGEAEALGVTTLHEEMDNGELRFRLRATDGSSYIRTQAASQIRSQSSVLHGSFLQHT